ncbi:Imm32 family immunity protein [Marispirochaeta sp.]|uniref:Imm32 family immunity protein n=1 Tax=Marispirochaeta sp. TaxID=2038653 RepID=UPI0029C73121|nr:Imm32 family immunity protein [Marispirochaeta sp.]
MSTQKKTLLSIELNKSTEQIEIHCNEDGLLLLVDKLESLKSMKNDHIHLKTSEFGGDDLSSDLIGIENEKINELKIFLW